MVTLRPPSRNPVPATTSPASSSGTPNARVVPSMSPYTPTHTPSRPATTRAPVVRRNAVGTSPERPYPRTSIAAASASERSMASDSTGMMIPCSARIPRWPPPRSRRARLTRSTLSASCGATDRATTTAAPTSYSAEGRPLSIRFGLASAFAAPTQISMVASRSPS